MVMVTHGLILLLNKLLLLKPMRKSRESYIQSIENGQKISENNKDYYSREFKRLGIDPEVMDGTSR